MKKGGGNKNTVRYINLERKGLIWRGVVGDEGKGPVSCHQCALVDLGMLREVGQVEGHNNSGTVCKD